LAISLAPTQENSYLALVYIYQQAQQFKQAAEILAEGRKHIPKPDSFLLPLVNNLVGAVPRRYRDSEGTHREGAADGRGIYPACRSIPQYRLSAQFSVSAS